MFKVILFAQDWCVGAIVFVFKGVSLPCTRCSVCSHKTSAAPCPLATKRWGTKHTPATHTPASNAHKCPRLKGVELTG